jgi:hypothetical protein
MRGIESSAMTDRRSGETMTSEAAVEVVVQARREVSRSERAATMFEAVDRGEVVSRRYDGHDGLISPAEDSP